MLKIESQTSSGNFIGSRASLKATSKKTRQVLVGYRATARGGDPHPPWFTRTLQKFTMSPVPQREHELLRKGSLHMQDLNSLNHRKALVHNGDSPVATVALDTEVVGATDDLEETLLTPRSSPGVATDPILSVGGGIDTPANNGDLMIRVGDASGILEDAAVVVDEGGGHGDSASDGATSGNLSHHVGNTGDGTILRDLPELVGLLGGALLGGVREIGGASLANVDGSAVQVDGLVGSASLIGDTVLRDVLVGSSRITTTASAGVSAVQENLFLFA